MTRIKPLSIEWPHSPLKKRIHNHSADQPSHHLALYTPKSTETVPPNYKSIVSCFLPFGNIVLGCFGLQGFQTSSESPRHSPKAPQHDTSGTISARRCRQTLRTAQGPDGHQGHYLLQTPTKQLLKWQVTWSYWWK